jgi:hypothetical protein
LKPDPAAQFYLPGALKKARLEVFHAREPLIHFAAVIPAQAGIQ